MTKKLPRLRRSGPGRNYHYVGNYKGIKITTSSSSVYGGFYVYCGTEELFNRYPTLKSVAEAAVDFIEKHKKFFKIK